jgi:hypothetical protein
MFSPPIDVLTCLSGYNGQSGKIVKPIVPSGSTQSSLSTIPGHAGLDNANAPDGGAPVLLAEAAGAVLLVAGAVLEGAVSEGIAPVGSAVMSVVGAPLGAGPVALASGAELIAGGALLITGGAELTAGAVLICGAALEGAGALEAAGADVPGAAVVACVLSRSPLPLPHAVANARAQTVAAVRRTEDVTEREELAIAALYHTLLRQVPAVEAEVAPASFNAVKFSLQGVCEPRLQPRTFPGSFRHRDENSPERSYPRGL